MCIGTLSSSVGIYSRSYIIFQKPRIIASGNLTTFCPCILAGSHLHRPCLNPKPSNLACPKPGNRGTLKPLNPAPSHGSFFQPRCQSIDIPMPQSNTLQISGGGHCDSKTPVATCSTASVLVDVLDSQSTTVIKSRFEFGYCSILHYTVVAYYNVL